MEGGATSFRRFGAFRGDWEGGFWWILRVEINNSWSEVEITMVSEVKCGFEAIFWKVRKKPKPLIFNINKELLWRDLRVWVFFGWDGFLFKRFFHDQARLFEEKDDFLRATTSTFYQKSTSHFLIKLKIWAHFSRLVKLLISKSFIFPGSGQFFRGEGTFEGWGRLFGLGGAYQNDKDFSIAIFTFKDRGVIFWLHALFSRLRSLFTKTFSGYYDFLTFSRSHFLPEIKTL